MLVVFTVLHASERVKTRESSDSSREEQEWEHRRNDGPMGRSSSTDRDDVPMVRSLSTDRCDLQVTTLQQVYRRIPAPVAKIKRPGKVLDPALLVQIERCVSHLVLNYSRKHTQSPAPVPGWVRVCVCAKSGMLEVIPRYGSLGDETRLGR